MACVRRYSKAPASGKSLILWPGCTVQQMNAVNPPASSRRARRGGRGAAPGAAGARRHPAGLVLEVAQAGQVLDTVRLGLDVAEHHRAGRAAAELVPDA